MKREDIRQQLEPALTAQLNELTAANHCGAGSLVNCIGRSEVRATITSVGRLACECELISVTDPQLAAIEPSELQNVANRLSQQLSYLEERLIVLEFDAVAAEVQLRSESPRVDDSIRTYFEVHVGKLGVVLQRFIKEPVKRRKIVPATFTRDVFCRVCVDLIAGIEG